MSDIMTDAPKEPVEDIALGTAGDAGDAAAQESSAEENDTETKSKIIEVPVSELASINSQEDLDKVLEIHRGWVEMVLNPKVAIASGRANLQGLDLRAYELTGVNLSGANMSGTNLQGVDLTGANLTVTNLRHALMQACNLKGARLIKTKIEDADLRGADLTDAILLDVDLTLAITEDDDKRLKKLNNDSLQLTGATIEDMASFNTFGEDDADLLETYEALASLKAIT